MTRSAQMFTAAIASLLVLAMGTNGQTMSQTISTNGSGVSAPRSSASAQAISVTRVGAPSATNSAVTTHTILVGKLDHKFEPDVVQAPVGDIIQFQFYPVNHSIVRAEYGYPCVPYEMTGVGKAGFYSGFRPVDAILNDPPIFRVRVNDTLPIFFYCSAPGSCINYEMVGVINPVQKERAGDSSYALSPGESFPSEADSTSVRGSIPTSTGSPTSSNDSGGLSGGAIGGLVVGAIAVVALIGALFFFFGRNKSLKEEVALKSPVGSPQTYQSPGGAFFPRSDGYTSAVPPTYSPVDYSTIQSPVGGFRGNFHEVGLYQTGFVDEASNAGHGLIRDRNELPSSVSPPPPIQTRGLSQKKASVHEMAG
ncbi:uncharacterized protein J3D65DRAFT_700665 [Phyllosticta citribraziliensis]|uniref:Extracellular serine-rich protein n=1 Tax=Phyllosticta citribraziliensis TaxID=989973 RepID=A0ABR1LH90_9PEZI